MARGSAQLEGRSSPFPWPAPFCACKPRSNSLEVLAEDGPPGRCDLHPQRPTVRYLARGPVFLLPPLTGPFLLPYLRICPGRVFGNDALAGGLAKGPLGRAPSPSGNAGKGERLRPSPGGPLFWLYDVSLTVRSITQGSIWPTALNPTYTPAVEPTSQHHSKASLGCTILRCGPDQRPVADSA